jgi:hypothetical protein
VTVSTDWYTEVLGLTALLLEEEADQVVGAVLSAGDGPSLGLHRDPPRAVAMAGFALVGVAVESRGVLSRWEAWLQEAGAVHSGIVEGPLGCHIDVCDPDGLIVQLHTPEHPSVEEA